MALEFLQGSVARSRVARLLGIARLACLAAAGGAITFACSSSTGPSVATGGSATAGGTNAAAGGSSGTPAGGGGSAGSPLLGDAGEGGMVETTPVPNPIVDGAARFTVLSPSLIRVEYAEDQAFTDAGTFNVQARMPATTGFTTDVVDGFRTIKTAKFTLRYKQASGRFNADNLVLVLPDGTSPAHGLHFRTDVCAMGQLCEAEDARLTGNLRSDRNHPGYTGSGFVDQ